eukprot:jgi/Mesvir1/13908/Mv16032-RA.1
MADQGVDMQREIEAMLDHGEQWWLEDAEELGVTVTPAVEAQLGTIITKREWQQQLKGQHDWKRRKMKRKLEKKKRHWKEGKQDRCTYSKGVHYEEGGAGDEDGDDMDVDAS